MLTASVVAKTAGQSGPEKVGIRQMGVTPHPDYKKIYAASRRLLGDAAGFRGTLYRACDPTYANTRDLLTGEGSRKYGGRWNAPGAFAVVYLAESLEGAVAETLGLVGRYGLDAAARLPLTLVAVDAVLLTVLDLTDARVRRMIGVTVAAMVNCEWRAENRAGREALTQALARAAFELGAGGVIVPSAVKRTLRNIDVFPGNLSGGARLTIRSSDKLPPPPAPGLI
jgi:RES domain-containing protein